MGQTGCWRRLADELGEAWPPAALRPLHSARLQCQRADWAGGRAKRALWPRPPRRWAGRARGASWPDCSHARSLREGDGRSGERIFTLSACARSVCVCLALPCSFAGQANLAPSEHLLRRRSHLAPSYSYVWRRSMATPTSQPSQPLSPAGRPGSADWLTGSLWRAAGFCSHSKLLAPPLPTLLQPPLPATSWPSQRQARSCVCLSGRLSELAACLPD